MATNVATLTARLEAETRKFNRDIDRAEDNLKGLDGTTRTTTQAQSRLDRQIGSTGLTMRTVFAGAAGAAAIGFLKDTVQEASNLQESINAVEKTFGPAADEIKRLGENAANNVGLANSEFNQLAVSFSAFVEDIDQGGGDVGQIMDDLTTRIADFASVMNIDVPEAAEKFRSGLAGETEPLRRFGIDVSAAAVNQKALELNLADTTSEITEQDKVLARYQLIMEQTNKTAGDFKDTQDDMANATRTFNANLKDLQAEAGTVVLPFLGELAALGNDVFVTLDKLTGPLQALTGSEGFGGLSSDLFDLIPVLGPVSQLFDAIAGSADDAAGSVISLDQAVRNTRGVSSRTSAERRARASLGPSQRSTTSVGGGMLVRQGGGFMDGPGIVGEAGAEMFVPTQSGSVVPAHSVSLTQNFQRVEGDNIESDIARGLILSGIGRFIESKDLF